MNDNVAVQNDNVPAKRPVGRPKRIGPPPQYWGKNAYYNVCLHLDPKVGKILNKMAERDCCPVGVLASEAITAWVQYLARISWEEAGDDNVDLCLKELDEASLDNQLIRSKKTKYIMDKAMSLIRHAVRDRGRWESAFPTWRWPGGETTT